MRKKKYFINVDLELESEHGFAALTAALEPAAYSLERPPGRACFELNSTDMDSPAPLLREFARLIGELSGPAREEWERATRRVFDIGIQSQYEPFHEGHQLDHEMLRALHAIGADLAFTVYAVDPRDAPPGSRFKVIERVLFWWGVLAVTPPLAAQVVMMAIGTFLHLGIYVPEIGGDPTIRAGSPGNSWAFLGLSLAQLLSLLFRRRTIAGRIDRWQGLSAYCALGSACLTNLARMRPSPPATVFAGAALTLALFVSAMRARHYAKH